MFAEDWTDEKLAELEKKIAKVYAEAEREVKNKADRYFKKFAKRYEQEYKAYLAGYYTKQEFDAWVLSQIGRGRRWTLLRNTLAKRITKANEVAASYINDYTPDVFTLNANFEAFIAECCHPEVSFVLFSEVSVQRLMMQDRKILPKRKVKVSKDKKWNEKKLQNALMQGIIQGDSINDLAKRFKNVTNMNANSAIRNARTAVTGAQNAGIYETMKREEAMGLEAVRYWNATKDLKTRPTHRAIDKEARKLGEKFSNGLLYPGDMEGDPAEVYNCRCTLMSKDYIQVTARKERVGNPQWYALGANDDERKKKAREIEKTTGKHIPKQVVVNEMSYKEWEQWKLSM